MGLMSSCNAGQLPYKERLQRTLTQQDENIVLLLKNTGTISDTAVENVFATQEKMREESDRSREEKVERRGRTRRRIGGGRRPKRGEGAETMRAAGNLKKE